MSKAKQRERVKGRKETGSFIAIPHICLRHENYILLSPYAKQLLIDLYVNYNGSNNGDLCCTWSMMKKRNWKSESTLSKVRKELLHYGWIVCSRYGGRNRASLYAVTFQSIDDCKGKLDIKETVTAPGNWKELKQIPKKEKKKNKSLVRDTMQLTTATVVKMGDRPCLVR